MKISSAIDDASSYFKAKSLSERASDLTSREQSIDQGISIGKAALEGMEKIESILYQAKDLATAALATDDASLRKSYAEQYDSLRKKIDSQATDSSYQGANLLEKDASYTIQYGDRSAQSMKLTGIDASSNGLGVSAASNNWASDDDIKAALTDLEGSSYPDQSSSSRAATDEAESSTAKEGAISTLKAGKQLVGTEISTMQVRKTYISGYKSALASSSTGSSLAASLAYEDDTSMLSLQTRQQTGTISLNFAGQQEQSVLSLFR